MNEVSKIVSLSGERRMKSLMERAEKGGQFTIAFIGGSITQDCLASRHELCYAYLVYEWWKKTFPASSFTYVNAGIGATTSQFGAARVQNHVLRYHPDLVVVEFSVNDKADAFFQETYEGLIRQILKSSQEAAVLVVNTVQYEDGVNAQEYHNEIAAHYGLPVCSMKDSLYRRMQNGEFSSKDITVDDLHPNDAGHRLMADEIGTILEEIRKAPADAAQPEAGLKEPLTANRYEHSFYLQNDNSNPETDGFVRDTKVQEAVRDVFCKGWTATGKGASITFKAVCEAFAVQYRKTVSQPASIAVAVVDGREDTAVVLDGNFDERWGDCPFITTVATGLPREEHTLTVTVVETHEDDVLPFYLIGVITSLQQADLRTGE